MLKDKKVLMVLSLIISVTLWMYVMGSVDPNVSVTIRDVPVKMVGEEVLEAKGLHADLVNPETITVVIQGRHSQVYDAKRQGISAYIDVSNSEMGRNMKDIEIRIPNGAQSVSVKEKSRSTATYRVK